MLSDDKYPIPEVLDKSGVDLNHLHNLASHLHTDKRLLQHLKGLYPKLHDSFLHFTKIGSKFCPRVLHTMELTIMKLYDTGLINTKMWKRAVESRELSAYDEQ